MEQEDRVTIVSAGNDPSRYFPLSPSCFGANCFYSEVALTPAQNHDPLLCEDLDYYSYHEVVINDMRTLQKQTDHLNALSGSEHHDTSQNTHRYSNLDNVLPI